MGLKKWGCAALIWAAGVSLAGAEPFDVPVPGRAEKDPLLLQGDFTAPRTANAPVLVCLHGLGSTRAEWQPLIDAARKKGWGAYAYDARGHGRSQSTLAGDTIAYDSRRDRTPAFWNAMPGDLARVLEALEKQKNVTPRQRVLVGASLGANVCLLAAGSSPSAGAIALSPGIEYAGLNVEGVMAGLPVPALLVSARTDLYAHASAERLLSLAGRPGFVGWTALDRGTARGDHGTQLFDGKLEERLLDWIAGVTKTAQPRTTKSPTPKR
ncbi:MAG: alpha/beta fold hydrolase [Elusimicrobia bacterium]|nr:alpha/beta fold hydrolase [Elusimicrobiota bacterium]